MFFCNKCATKSFPKESSSVTIADMPITTCSSNIKKENILKDLS